MQYIALMLIILIAIAIIVVVLPYVSMLISTINNANAMLYTFTNSSTYLSGTWLVNGTSFKQVSTSPSNKLVVEVAEGSYIYMSNSTWSEMLSDNGDNGPIFSPYAVFNLSAGYYKYDIPTSSYDFEEQLYSVLSYLAAFMPIALALIIFMILAYSKRR